MEQIADPRTDIWAFGVMLFEMLAGIRPFSGANFTETLTAILTQSVPDLEALRPDVPIALVDLIYRMLEKNKNARIRNVRYVGAELADILQGNITRTALTPQLTALTVDALRLPKHNLPAQTTPFVGREAELSELEKFIDDPKTRLITILAPGGMGKTRLALELAGRYIQDVARTHYTGPLKDLFSDGVYIVELAPISDSANIISAIAEATGYQFQGDGRELKQQILDFLGNKDMLLVLDNFRAFAGRGIVRNRHLASCA